MSYEEAFGPAEAHYKNKVMHQTWGHLFPEKDYYEGKVRVANTIYTGATIIDENSDLPGSSPWWFDAINTFIDTVETNMEDGEVSEFDISVNIVQCVEELEQWQLDDDPDVQPDKWQEIRIVELKKTIIAGAY